MWQCLGLDPIIETGPAANSHRAAVYFNGWDRMPWIAVYRNPFDWYASLYNYHVKMDWSWKPRLNGITFHNFVDYCLEAPMSRHWESLVLNPRKLCHKKSGKLSWIPPLYMIQYENMYEEFEIVLRILGYDVTKEQMDAFPKRNIRSQRGLRSGIINTHCPALTPKLRERIAVSDATLFKYYENHDEIVAGWR